MEIGKYKCSFSSYGFSWSIITLKVKKKFLWFNYWSTVYTGHGGDYATHIDCFRDNTLEWIEGRYKRRIAYYEMREGKNSEFLKARSSRD